MKFAVASTTLFFTVATSVALAQSAPQAADQGAQKAETPKVYHAGGKHDQRQHEAALRARANGSTTEQTQMHAGGRHDETAHRAAMKAEARQATENAGK